MARPRVSLLPPIAPPLKRSEEDKGCDEGLERFLATLVAICTLSAGALASDWQRPNDQKPPPKEQKEIPRENKKPPPPREDNKKRGKP